MEPTPAPSHPGRERAWPLWIVAIAAGGAGWWSICWLSGRREAWDVSEYGSIAYPLFALTTLVLGYLGRIGAWRWPLGLALGQFAGATLHEGELSNLWPLSLVIFAMYSAPLLATAWYGARLRRWRDGRG